MKRVPKGLRDRIVVKKDAPEELTKGGIVIPENCRDKVTSGIVLNVGPGGFTKTGERMPIEDIQEGDRVLFAKYCGSNPVIDDEEYFIVNYRDILAVFSKRTSEKPDALLVTG